MWWEVRAAKLSVSSGYHGKGSCGMRMGVFEEE